MPVQELIEDIRGSLATALETAGTLDRAPDYDRPAGYADGLVDAIQAALDLLDN